jgi:hypothetical protein
MKIPGRQVFGGDGLDKAIAAIPQEPIPQAAINRVASAARRLQADRSATMRAPPLKPSDRFGWHRPRLTAVLVAGLALAGILTILVPEIGAQRHATAAFAEVVKRVKETSGVRFSTTQADGIKGRCWMAGRRQRVELNNSVVIVVDAERGLMLALQTFAKVAQVLPLERASIVDGDLVEQLAGLEKAGVEPVPGEPDTFRGKGLAVLGLCKTPDTPVIIVVDHESRLPTRIVIGNADPKQPADVVLDDFHWGEPIDEALLSVDPPEGYEPGAQIISPE